MMSVSDNNRFQRVLVSVDATPEGMALLEMAADIARCLESQLTGLYIEDEDMVSFAGLPVGREISITGACMLDLTHQRLQSHFHNQASQIRRRLETVASARRVNHSFIVRQGHPEREIRDASEKTDILAIDSQFGAILKPRGQELRRRFLESSTEGLLVVPDLSKTAHKGPVCTIYTGTPSDDRMILMVMRIAQELERQVVVALIPGDGDPRKIEQHLDKILGDPTSFILIEIDSISSFFKTISYWRPGLVVVPVDLVEHSGWHWDRPELPLLILKEG